MTTDFLSRFRTLFPKWIFFSKLGHQPQLWYQTIDPIGTWVRLIPGDLIQRKFWQIFYNPELNFQLYQISRLQDFQQDLNHDPDLIQSRPSYLRLCEWISADIRGRNTSFSGSFRFKFVVREMEQESSPEDIFVSEKIDFQKQDLPQ